ncbi:bacillithiol biosynthesis cysteine-adding enzyme BshC [Anaerobranca californiensis DSM 14826]|jgi:bacillithiol biosynthesis cysteine-adding enzyme BshC|uniref:Putative cysteine ligase BshC n=1 Tax=Anaerobranca californiensis DSM 14826 TaxID=1120989 RepID=A0A1M6RRY1_9FIRM|nr:bacillithiol biosynthesis cysteine-adding enzyme BshC [Anaerobranca californiensis]SHK35180.1 bacillithiol biosynthesis cysteine-adding enzyme BshC [Anaerobranca californiensis DSM 14826]
MENIYQNYIELDPKVLSLFPYPPSLQGLKERMAEIKDKRVSTKLCQYLKEYNSSLNCSEKTLKNIEKLQSGAKVVVTGQQCGLLGGPLYTIYKALTAVKLAGKLAIDTGEPVVPIFWVADEDHDWLEINNTTFLDREGNPKKFIIEGQGNDFPAFYREISTEDFNGLISFIQNLGFSTEYLPEIIGFLEETFDKNYSNWFAKLITKLLAGTGIVLVDSKAKVIKSEGKGIFKEMLINRDRLMEELKKTNNNILSLGYSLQNPVDYNTETNLFILKDNYRYKLKKDKEGFLIKTGEVLGEGEIIGYIDGGLISPNVFLRPVIQDVVFPTLAYVAGPGEVNYLAQIKDMYKMLTGYNLPVIYPRQSFLLIEPHVKKFLERYSLDYPHIHNLEGFKREVIHNDLWEGLERDFEGFKTDIIHRYNRLIDKISTINPQLSTLGDKNRQLIVKQIDFLQNKTYNAHKDKYQRLLQNIEKVQKNCYPYGIEQQRIVSPFYFLIKYYPVLIGKITESIQLENFKLQYIEL